ncbi:hypothetical protein ACS0TY_035825 [Phlomoides rotata]
MDGMPFSHALAVCREYTVDPIIYVPKCYSSTEYALTYSSGFFTPLPNMEEWDEPNFQLRHNPERIIRCRGRDVTSRIHNEMDWAQTCARQQYQAQDGAGPSTQGSTSRPDPLHVSPFSLLLSIVSSLSLSIGPLSFAAVHWPSLSSSQVTCTNAASNLPTTDGTRRPLAASSHATATLLKNPSRHHHRPTTYSATSLPPFNRRRPKPSVAAHIPAIVALIRTTRRRRIAHAPPPIYLLSIGQNHRNRKREEMSQRKSVNGRPSGTDGSDFSFRMVVDSRYQKVAKGKSRMCSLILTQVESAAALSF